MSLALSCKLFLFLKDTFRFCLLSCRGKSADLYSKSDRRCISVSNITVEENFINLNNNLFFFFLLQVAETLPEEVLVKMSAPAKSDVPIITPNDLAEADGFLFGFPTRFGMMAAQFKAFLDATGGLWRTQQLAGKPAGIFYCTGSQGGGQETTA